MSSLLTFCEPYSVSPKFIPSPHAKGSAGYSLCTWQASGGDCGHTWIWCPVLYRCIFGALISDTGK